MFKKFLIQVAFMAWGLTISVAHAQNLGAHVHGHADLEVVVLDGQAVVTLLSPADSLLGFEHAPRTAAQKQTVEKMRLALSDGTLFQWGPSAACTLTGFDDSGLKKLQSHGDHDHGHDHEHHHLDISIGWTYTCDPGKLPTALTVQLFNLLPTLDKLHVAAVASEGQYAATLTAGDRVFRFEAGR